MQRFTELRVWQRTHASQMRRAATSVATNIAEGSKRRGRPDYARFLNIAEGSLAETEYLLILSRDLGYLSAQVAEPVLLEASRIAQMLHALRARVEETESLERFGDA